jgi:hypothetical protein
MAKFKRSTQNPDGTESMVNSTDPNMRVRNHLHKERLAVMFEIGKSDKQDRIQLIQQLAESKSQPITVRVEHDPFSDFSDSCSVVAAFRDSLKLILKPRRSVHSTKWLYLKLFESTAPQPKSLIGKRLQGTCDLPHFDEMPENM